MIPGFETVCARITAIGGSPPDPIDVPDFGEDDFAGAIHVAQQSTESPKSAMAIVRQAALAQGVDPALALAVADQESGFNPQATSSAGARGLMQLMPATAAALGVGDTYDPVENAEGGTRYLHDLIERFRGDVRLALAAYNAGPGAVDRYGGIPPFAETQRYVERVMELARSFRSATER
jgi:soluble lytic murein transglycosylase-like protein